MRKVSKMGSDLELKFTRLLKGLQEKYEAVTEYRKELRWRFFQGNVKGAYEPDFDDSSWEEVTFPFVIDPRKGDGWLRCDVTFPNEVAGIKVSGSIAKVSSSVILAATEIFVNSKKAFSADYWTELRGPKIILKEKVDPQDRFVIVVHILSHHEPIQIPAFNLTYSKVEKVAFEIHSFINELRFVKTLREDIVKEALEDFNLNVLNRSPLDVVKEINKVRGIFSRISDEAKRFKVHLVGHAHIDMNWLWPWKETIGTINRTFTTMIDLMNQYADLCFSQSQAVTYSVAEEKFPRLFRTIRKRIKEGRWEVTASMWVESDLNMGGTEALVRQFLYAKRYVKEKFGVEPEICWQPDTFGHIWTLPQILKKCGIRYYYFMRCGKGYPLFWWEGPDGSRVLAFTSVYNNTVTPSNILEICNKIHKGYGLKTSMFVYGVGDHGGGPTIEDVEAAHEIQKKVALPKVIFSSAQAFLREVEQQIKRKDIPVVKDELNPIFDGCYTTHSDIKRYNRLCERLLVDAEKFCILSGVYPKKEIRKAWLNTLFNQFHDILCGSGIHKAYVYPRKLAEEAVKTASEALKISIKKIAKNIRFSKEGIPIVVFNPLPWNRIDIVRAKVPKNLASKDMVAVSAEREKVPVQVNRDEVLFIAKVPSIGYITYYLTEGKLQTDRLARGNNLLENEYFRVEIDPASGTIRSMYDKTANRSVFKKQIYQATMPVNSNLLQVLYELPHPMSAWIIGEISRVENLVRNAEVKLKEDGPMRAVVKVIHKYRNSEISQDITIYKSIPRLDFFTKIDWNEFADERTEAPMLKVAFTPLLRETKATFEIPFGYVERPSDGRESPALRWIDVSDGEYGVSLLNDSKYGFDVKGNTVRMTLIRTSYSPDPRPDQGRHEFLYSIYPHKGGWKEALTFRKGYEINHPLEAVIVEDPSGSSRTLPETKSFIQVKPENVVISCVKQAEDSEDLIIRLYDATGAGAEVEVLFSFKVSEIQEADLMERETSKLEFEDGKLSLKLKPFEIKTVRVKKADQAK